MMAMIAHSQRTEMYRFNHKAGLEKLKPEKDAGTELGLDQIRFLTWLRMVTIPEHGMNKSGHS